MDEGCLYTFYIIILRFSMNEILINIFSTPIKARLPLLGVFEISTGRNYLMELKLNLFRGYSKIRQFKTE